MMIFPEGDRGAGARIASGSKHREARLCGVGAQRGEPARGDTPSRAAKPRQ